MDQQQQADKLDDEKRKELRKNMIKDAVKSNILQFYSILYFFRT